VVTRWTRLFSGLRLIANFVAGEPLSEAELQTIRATIAIWRDRLYDISCSWPVSIRRWPGKPIAKTVAPDFREKRFKSQALPVAALLSVTVLFAKAYP
jgi:hypothetical protein